MKKNLFSVIVISAVLFLLIIFIPALYAAAEEDEDLEMINRPVNTSGMTGLLFTTTPFTEPARKIEIGAGAMSEKSTIPDYTVSEIPILTATFGLTPEMEIAVKGSNFRRTDESGNQHRGTGDLEVSWKWNFLPQEETSSLPALAVFITGIAPTSNRQADVPGVAHWGARFGLSAGREIVLADHVIGVYADGQIAVQDLNDPTTRDRYGEVNAGILFPISKYRNLQMFLEYSVVTGIDRLTSIGGDYSAVTPGLRLVTERFNLSFGSQFLRKQVQGFDNSTRIIGMISIKI